MLRKIFNAKFAKNANDDANEDKSGSYDRVNTTRTRIDLI